MSDTISDAAKRKACELANAAHASDIWSLEHVGDNRFGALTALAKHGLIITAKE